MCARVKERRHRALSFLLMAALLNVYGMGRVPLEVSGCLKNVFPDREEHVSRRTAVPDPISGKGPRELLFKRIKRGVGADCALDDLCLTRPEGGAVSSLGA